MPKLKTLEKAKSIIKDQQELGKKIVFTNGCFDILHAGHTSYLQDAKSCGDFLVLGLNSDKSVQSIKGPKRPIVAEKYRAKTLSALESIDLIVLFDEDTPISTINTLKPNIFVKGGDYSFDTLPEYPVVIGYGGEVKILPFVDGLSTSTIIDKILEVYGS
ncbi:D-glycero-beta-D-manno-heptose 1-phosphate adenylyltransferase [Candidatus Marinamargulisbacteria bacterium SCGC AAA071-K20]|nr:D-glycero-beta-D-manno-heptose 1-phosphate adenylyltransferase [Candidatus Marinamargulisbacteria bacterium SCGC AAA071-K20]